MAKAIDPLLDDAKPAKKSVKKPAKAPAKKAEASNVMGRPASETTQERRKLAMRLAKNKNGVDNVTLAGKLGVTTAQSQTVCRALVAAGQLKVTKDRETGRVTYRAA
jgi:hypothetical protein